MFKLIQKSCTLALCGLLASCNLLNNNNTRQLTCVVQTERGGEEACRLLDIRDRSSSNSNDSIDLSLKRKIDFDSKHHPKSIFASSSDLAFNIVIDRPYTVKRVDIRPVASIAADYGVIVVRADSSWQNLDQVMKQFKANPDSIIFSGSTPSGFHGWLKPALLFKAVGITPPHTLRFVTYFDADKALKGLKARESEVCFCSLSSLKPPADRAGFRILAITSSLRLKGEYSNYPTAIEQGYDLTFKVWQGYYLPANLPDRDYQWWTDKIKALVQTEEFRKELKNLGLQPEVKIGTSFEREIKREVEDFQELFRESRLKQ